MSGFVEKEGKADVKTGGLAAAPDGANASHDAGHRKSTLNYLDATAQRIGAQVGMSLVDQQEAELLRLCALLAFAKGHATTREDVHDAWAAWTAKWRPDHRSLVPFSMLSPEVQALDQPYVDAIVASVANVAPATLTPAEKQIRALREGADKLRASALRGAGEGFPALAAVGFAEAWKLDRKADELSQTILPAPAPAPDSCTPKPGDPCTKEWHREQRLRAFHEICDIMNGYGHDAKVSTSAAGSPVLFCARCGFTLGDQDSLTWTMRCENVADRPWWRRWLCLK